MSDISETSKCPETYENSSDGDGSATGVEKLSINAATDSSAFITKTENIDVKFKNEEGSISKNDSGKLSEKIKQENDSDDLDATGDKHKLQLKINKLQDDLTNRDQQIEKLKKTNNEKEKKIAELEHDVTNRDEQIEDGENHIEDLEERIAELLTQLTLSNEKSTIAREKMITEPPHDSQKESYVLLKVGSYEIIKNVKIKLFGNLYYGIRRRNETVDTAIKTFQLVHPDSSVIYKLETVPNSKHLHSALKKKLRADCECSNPEKLFGPECKCFGTIKRNIINLSPKKTQDQLIELIEEVNNDKSS